MPTYSDVPTLTQQYVKTAASVVPAIRRAIVGLDAMPGYGHVWYNPKTKEAWVSLGDSDEKPTYDAWRRAISKVPGVKSVRLEAEYGPKDDGWLLVKRAFSPAHAVSQLANYSPGPTNAPYGGPSPLAALLASGLLGAGVGYGAGVIGEQFLPDEHFRPGHLRRTLALLGAAGAAAPAAWWGSIAHRDHPTTPGWKAWLSSYPFRKEDLNSPIKEACAAARECLEDCQPTTYFKQALQNQEDEYGVGAAADIQDIPAEQFVHTVWQDPYTPVPIRSATAGLVSSAASWRGVNTVSPMDIARIGIGMGSGYASGLFVGKTLGALAGLRPESQQKLQQAGTWAGILSNVVPIIFRGAA